MSWSRRRSSAGANSSGWRSSCAVVKLTLLVDDEARSRAGDVADGGGSSPRRDGRSRCRAAALRRSAGAGSRPCSPVRSAAPGSCVFKGLHGYHGKLQWSRSYAERRARGKRALERLAGQRRASVGARAIAMEILTGGGSGSVAIDLELGGLNELQPGSYVFMDANYRRIEWDEAGPPATLRFRAHHIGQRREPAQAADRAMVDVGWKTASSDSGPPVSTPARACLRICRRRARHSAQARRKAPRSSPRRKTRTGAEPLRHHGQSVLGICDRSRWAAAGAVVYRGARLQPLERV